MISSGKIVKIAMRWENLGVFQRKRISLTKGYQKVQKGNATLADKGHFVAYTTDQRRFMIPLKYLENKIINDLLKMSEEKFGSGGDKPITLPCEALVMEYIMALIAHGTSKEIEKGLIALILSSSSSSMNPLSSSLFHDQSRTNSALVYGHQNVNPFCK